MEKRNIFLYEENKLKEVIEIINKQIKEAEENFSKQEHTIIGFKEGQRGTQFIRQGLMSLYATEVYNLCKEAGVTLTSVGATFPYRKDPNNSNLRIAPTYPTVEELEEAANLFAVAVKLASVNKLLEG